LNRVLVAGVVGLFAGAAISACVVDREGAPCDRDDNCPRSQYCDLTNKCVELKPTLEADVACQLVLVSLTQKFSECVGGRADHWYQGIDVPSICRTLTSSVTAGRLTYAPMQLKVCRAELLGESCADLVPRNAGQMLDGCDTLFTGTVQAGAACTTDRDCVGGWCDTTTGCPGTCKGYIQQGGPCTATQLCQPGLACYKGACAPYVTSGHCDAGPCQPYSGYCDGAQQCRSRQPEGASGCFYFGVDFNCQLNTKCVGGLLATKTCLKGLPLGAACTQQTNACDYFTSCQPGDGGTFCQRDPGPGGNCGIVNNDIIGCTSSRCSGLLGGACLQYIPLGGACGDNAACGPLARCVNGACRAEFCQ
jgi:hypothetical protein